MSEIDVGLSNIITTPNKPILTEMYIVVYNRARNWWTARNTDIALFATLIIGGFYTLLQLSLSGSWIVYPGYVAITALFLNKVRPKKTTFRRKVK